MEPRDVVRGAAVRIQHMMNKFQLPDAGTSAIDFLKAQHRDIQAAFDELAKTSNRSSAKRMRLVEKIASLLGVHTKVEELIFYPAVKGCAPELVLESYEEHTIVKTLLRRVMAVAGNDETFDAKCMVLRELVFGHIAAEEEQLFPLVERDMGDAEQSDLAAQMAAKTIAFEKASEPHHLHTKRGANGRRGTVHH